MDRKNKGKVTVATYWGTSSTGRAFLTELFRIGQLFQKVHFAEWGGCAAAM